MLCLVSKVDICKLSREKKALRSCSKWPRLRAGKQQCCPVSTFSVQVLLFAICPSRLLRQCQPIAPPAGRFDPLVMLTCLRLFCPCSLARCLSLPPPPRIFNCGASHSFSSDPSKPSATSLASAVSPVGDVVLHPSKNAVR